MHASVINSIANCMSISRRDYDLKPLAIRHGALLLWGKLIVSQWEGNMFRQLYSLNGFLAQVCFDAHQQKVTCICTFIAN